MTSPLEVVIDDGVEPIALSGPASVIMAMAMAHLDRGACVVTPRVYRGCAIKHTRAVYRLVQLRDEAP